MAEHARKGEKGIEPHFISARLLEALGGLKAAGPAGELVDRGGYLWGVEDREKGAGLFNHVLLVSRVAYALAQDLQREAPETFGALDMRSIVEAALLHDVSKLYAQDREALPKEMKASIGLKPGFKEADVTTDDIGARWLKDLGFPPEVTRAIEDHFPQQIIEDPYWKIVLVADFMTGQEVMSVDKRIADVRDRWIDHPVLQGKALSQPRMDPALFAVAERNIRAVAKELFGILGTTDVEFIKTHDINNPEKANRWERFLMGTYTSQREQAARRHVARDIG